MSITTIQINLMTRINEILANDAAPLLLTHKVYLPSISESAYVCVNHDGFTAQGFYDDTEWADYDEQTDRDAAALLRALRSYADSDDAEMLELAQKLFPCSISDTWKLLYI